MSECPTAKVRLARSRKFVFLASHPGAALGCEFTGRRRNAHPIPMPKETEAVFQAALRLVSTSPDIYGGAVLKEGGRVVLTVVGGDGLEAAKSAALSAVGADLLFKVVDHSARDLSHTAAVLNDEISHRRMAHALGTRIEPERDVVVVTSDDPAAIEPILTKRFGSRVVVEKGEMLVAALGRWADNPPFYGGAGMWLSGTTKSCSTGFTLTNYYGTRYMITAGHCGNLGTTWLNGTRTYTVGTVQFRTIDNGTNDAELLGGATYAAYIYTASTTFAPVRGTFYACSGCYVRFDGSKTGGAYAYVGNSNTSCQTISYGSSGGTYYACNLVEATSTGIAPCQYGDSGGPVYVTNGNALYAVGIITALKSSSPTCWYTQIQPILSYWTSTIATG